MIPVDTCEPYFEYMRKMVELDHDLMELVASQLSEITFPPKHIIVAQGGACNKGCCLLFQARQDLTI